MVCVVGRMRDLILQLSKSSIYSTKPPGTYHIYGDSLHGYYITLDGLMMLQLGLSLRTMRYYESCIEAFHEAETNLNHTAFRRNQWEVRP
ncbi:hypothetical protein L6R34_24875, partial [Escherichia coli]|nr:hypothetical protein [Escherichia coli]